VTWLRGRGQWKEFSPEARSRWNRHVFVAFRFGVIWFGVLGGFIAFSTWELWHGGDEGFVPLAALATGLFLFSAWCAYGRLQSLLFAPHNLMPYFSARVPGPGLVIGVELLRHSRSLDTLAVENGIRPIGEFVSDDDFFDGRGPSWHPASDGVAVFDALLQRCASHPSVQAARKDLECIRDRLLFAQASGIQFCLLLRDVHVTNGMEWEQRKGCC
jgi:hypothetical protein